MTRPTELNLANLAGGELLELATRELRKICENIADPNVKTGATRKLNIQIAIKPDSKGQTAEIAYQIKTALPGPQASKTTAFIAMNPETKDISLFGVDLRQQQLFEAPKEELVTEIKPKATTEAAKLAEPAAAPKYAPGLKTN